MRKILDILLYTLAVAGITMILTLRCSDNRTSVEAVVCDTVIHHDTLTYVDVKVMDSVVFRYEKARLPLVHHFRDTTKMIDTSYLPDSIPNKAMEDSLISRNVTDSADVILPISQIHVQDSMFDVYASGFRVRIDSIKVYPRIDYITRTITRKEYDKRKTYSLGAGIGIGWNGRAFEPYIGLSLHYKIFEW